MRILITGAAGFVGKNLLMRLIGCIPTNKFVTDNAPWTLAKEEKWDECGQVLYTVLEVMCTVASLIYPYCPNIAKAMAEQWGKLSFTESVKG